MERDGREAENQTVNANQQDRWTAHRAPSAARARIVGRQQTRIFMRANAAEGSDGTGKDARSRCANLRSSTRVASST